MPMASKNPSLVGATNQALNFQRAPAGVQAAVKSNPLVASGEIPPEAAHQLMSWSAKGGVTPQAIQQMNSKTPRPAGFVDPREAATRAGG
jgi:L-asparaginase/Glu-tRNA(Gln) amidotransferase subunit D